VSQRTTNRNEQRAARSLQRERGIPYLQALNQVRAATHERAITTPLATPIAVTQQPKYVPAEQRFVISMVDDLRRHGAAGAAQAVMRSRATDWFQDRTTVVKDTGDLLRLTSYGLENWGLRGLRAIEEDELVTLAKGWLPLTQSAQAEPLQQIVGSWRDVLRSRETPSPPRLPVRRETVIDVLGHLQLALRRITTLSEASSWDSESQSTAAQAAEQLGRALSRTFRGGIITALPPETQAALVALRSH
jgi:hypothetical protein